MKRTYGTGSVIKVDGSDYWYILWRANGKQHKESSRSLNKSAAEALLRTRLAEAENGVRQIDKKLRYEDLRASLLLDYANKQNKSLAVWHGQQSISGLRHLDKFFAGVLVSRINTDLIQKFIASRLSEGASRPTVNRSLALLRRALNLARQHGKIQVTPHFPMLRENPARQGFVTNEQFGLLLEALPESLRPLVTFLFYCGVRLGEALQITWSQVDLIQGLIRLEGDQTKSREARILPLPDQLLDYLRSVSSEARVGQVFAARNLRKAWKAAATAAGVPTLLIHDLRRSAVRNLIQAGVSENVAMKISGHKTQHVFRRYHIVSTTDLQQAMRKVQTKVLDLDAKAAALLPAAD